jgi:nucleotide-binding universal stress UspA family protein
MSQTALYPTDFSEVSLKVVDVFDQLKAMGVDKVILLHVVDERGYHAMEAYANLNDLQKQNIEHAKSELENLAQKLRDQGVEVIPKLEIGMPVQQILKAEKNDQVSLIVLGSHGKSNMADIFLGSVAEKVIRKCTKPVFVVKR